MANIQEQALVNDASMNDYDAAYRDIVELYDIAEEMAGTVEDHRALHQQEQMDILEPLVEEVISAADALSQQFCEYAEASDKEKAAKKFKIRPVFQRVFKAVDECLSKLNGASAEVAENVTIVVLPAVERLMRHAERVFGRVLSIVERARDTVKKRKEFYEMVVRESHLAQMMQQRMAIEHKF